MVVDYNIEYTHRAKSITFSKSFHCSIAPFMGMTLVDGNRLNNGLYEVVKLEDTPNRKIKISYITIFDRIVVDICIEIPRAESHSHAGAADHTEKYTNWKKHFKTLEDIVWNVSRGEIDDFVEHLKTNM